MLNEITNQILKKSIDKEYKGFEMTTKKLEQLLLKKRASFVDYPFGEEVAVFKVGSKMFALFNEQEIPLRINLKCEPNNALALRDIYESVIEGYHMNKKHWNTVILDGSIPLDVLQDMIDESYDLVVKKLTKKEKEKLSSF